MTDFHLLPEALPLMNTVPFKHQPLPHAAAQTKDQFVCLLIYNHCDNNWVLPTHHLCDTLSSGNGFRKEKMILDIHFLNLYYSANDMAN